MNSPFVFIIFGATGDLTSTKLMPALYRLYKQKQIHEDIYVVGVGRREMDREAFCASMQAAVQKAIGKDFDLDTWGDFINGMYYVQGYFEDPKLYSDIVSLLSRIDDTMQACVPRFFYLATPPVHYAVILKHLETSKLAEGCPAEQDLASPDGFRGFTRVLIEKPFGKDLTTAKALDRLLASIFEEKQIYRIDHYLGKETLQNVLAFRFANGIFEPTWNRHFIDHVQITLAESTGVGSRGGFYDGVGALRDVVQNHMLEMLALIAMEQPRAFDADSIRDTRVAAMKAIVPISPKAVGRTTVRGRYEGYTKEKQVDPGSQTETFVAVKLMLSTPRWKGVPFYLRTGKHLAQKVTEISIHYKKPIVCTGDLCLFEEAKVLRNVLSLRIQPDEGITLRLMVKEPGYGPPAGRQGMKLAATKMEFCYGDAFDIVVPDAYERLLLDVIRGDQTLFARTDGIEASWKVVTPILRGWERSGVPMHTYQPGSMGPAAANALLEADGRHWFLQKDPV